MKSQQNRVAEGREQSAVGDMFDRISVRYDLANRLLSMGIDQLWRRRAIASLGDLRDKRMLDVACGTGDLLQMSARMNEHSVQLIGLDYSHNMMKFGQRRHGDANYHWLRGSADALPLPDQSVDAITIAFGIRNVAQFERALREFKRVLNPGGALAILEFGLPQMPIWREVYGFYFNHLLPILGGILSGNFDAYRYLPRSVAAFPYGESFSQRVASAGFQTVHARPLTGGVAYLYTARA